MSTIHLSFEIEGPATNEQLSAQAVRMSNYLLGTCRITDLLNDEAKLSTRSHCISGDWTEDWPTEPGHYWFYGWCFRPWGSVRVRPPEWHFVRVSRTANSLAFVTDGHFLYKSEGGEGLWMPAMLPEPPTQLRKGGEKDE